jgi:hypothetical protein
VLSTYQTAKMPNAANANPKMMPMMLETLTRDML